VSCLPLNVLDLAIGWPEGLQCLLTKWMRGISNTIELAVFMDDSESLQLLLESPAPLFNELHERLGFMRAIFSSPSRETRHLIVEALQRRRNTLAELGRQYLDEGDQGRFGLLDEWTLDAKARPLYDMLKERSFPVSVGLFPGPAVSVYSLAVTVYLRYYEHPSNSDTMACFIELWNSGFRDIDDGDNEISSFYTPLQDLLGNVHNINPDTSWIILSYWLLSKGASPTFQGQTTTGVNNILSGIAKTLDSISEQNYEHVFTWSWTTKLLKYATTMVSPLQTDQCDCFCSSNGCLPSSQLLHPPRPLHPICCCSHRGYRIFSWMDACGLMGDDLDKCLEESVRPELFNRLGMVHTCCFARKTIGDADRILLQEEDGHLKAQLDLLMQAYRSSRDIRLEPPEDGSNFVFRLKCRCPYEDVRWAQIISGNLAGHWAWWWFKVDQILPDTLSAWAYGYDGEEIEAEALLLHVGYQGFDFIDVIWQHFAEYIDPDFDLDSMCPENDIEHLQGVVLYEAGQLTKLRNIRATVRQ
jgi:hypothetical protein